MSQVLEQPQTDTGPRTDPQTMIEARGLSKFYGPFAAVQNVSFAVPRGQVAAFLGPNGAGKSTTMKLLTGFLAPSEGTAWIGGYNVGEQRLDAAKLLGYLPENGPLYPEMTPSALLNYIGQVRGMPSQQLRDRLDYVATRCDLRSVWGKPIGKLSKGFRQRVGMAQALLHDPQVLILDEPTSGLDPNQTHEVRNLIRGLSKTKTILLSTHILQEVKAVCGRVILIHESRVVFDGTVEEMEGAKHNMEQRFRELTGVAT